MPKVWNKHHKDTPSDAVYVGRPTIWGNPYEIGKDGTREEVIEKFKTYLKWREDTFYKAIRLNLKGKDLVCWCAPKSCHADILLEIANEEGGDDEQ